ncbi:hypothetical protein HUE87_02815 [Candidatus Sulfurimonas marisnigri]|uniref:Outer membrane protein n=1 Tax=Candidatus Sulfurimonas marisnigri TaxID=2740405 RepID=A0A7S7M283_9BACT|nr:hypothetical protein [Candidatus Sulfurimonas marisnigri]QOY55188.1 hypothetical protein HUE87_02815 [Candidatus Sulfurimonas marisnigri]
MKYFAWIIGILVAFFVTAYVMAFTSIGNGMLAPTIEAKIREQTKLDSKLRVFSLSMSDFEIELELNKNNILTINGKYSLFKENFNIEYKVKLNELKTLKSLTGTELNKSLYTSGIIKGNIAFVEIDGVSDLAQSNTTYHIELTDLNPTSIIARVKDLKLASLLDMTSQSAYASADVNLDINFKNINLHALDGNIILSTKNGIIDPTLMKSDFNVTIPKTTFFMNLDAKLKGDYIDYSCELASNLFNINSSGKVLPEPFKTDAKYSLNIKELAVLKPITGADIRGVFKLRGIVNGTKEKLTVKGESDVASSTTKFEAVLKDFSPAKVKASVKNMQLKKVLYMLKQPHYTDGLISLDADISDARVGKLKGKVVSTLKDGVLDSEYITKISEFKSAMPNTIYSTKTETILDGNNVDMKVDFNSNIANIDIKRARFNIKDKSLKSDYEVGIEDLDKLFFATNQHMRGKIILNGDLSKTKDLDLTLHTKLSGGKIDAKLHNDDFSAEIKSVDTIGVLNMLIYPEIFKSTLNAKLDYNLALSKGVLSGHVADGHFVKNQTFDLIKQYTKFDMYRESFNGDISAKINKENILASLNIRSKQASIKSTGTKLNTKTSMINSDIIVQTKKDTITANINGDVNSPKVRVDLDKFLKSKAGEAVKKKIDKLFKKFF